MPNCSAQQTISSPCRSLPQFTSSFPDQELIARMATQAFLAPAPAIFPHRFAAAQKRSPVSPIRRRPQAALATPPPPLHPSDHDSPPDHPPSPALPLVGREALEDVLLSTPSDTLVVVLFHARWCRVCKTIIAKLPRVAVDYSRVVWRSVDFAQIPNKPLCSDLGVKLLPTFSFYRGGMSLDDKPIDHFTTGPFGVKRLIEHLGLQSEPFLFHN